MIIVSLQWREVVEENGGLLGTFSRSLDGGKISISGIIGRAEEDQLLWEEKKTKRQKDKKTKRQRYKKTKRLRDKKTKRQKKTTKRQKDKKTKRQRPKREFNIVTSGQFRTLAMFAF